ncbi:type III secretion system chaperone family protein [Streptomonospora nanhaiensis]|uniref:hypothetical protein n=1 Tax=Streptomonospora nanhaiensis TaxID=1323731 RepID=UPI001C38B573|nr:hypothetical protein [Streptomonospora nanhaiensis]MBV2364497.1 hypothetical protein [Streptomonospora nanhaiensis]
MHPLIPLIILGMLVLFGGVLFLGFGLPAIRERRRKQELAEWARGHGWRYDEERSDLLGVLFPPVPPHLFAFHRARHVLSGTHRGRAVLAFEHVQPNPRTGTGGGSRATVQRVVAVETPGSTPLLDVREQEVGHKLLDLIGLRDFEVGNPAFDRAFRVATSHEGFARDVLNGPLADRLLAEGGDRRRPLRFCGGHLTTTERAPLDPDEVGAVADHLIDLLQQVDPRVWDGGRPA